ncbi:MAG: SBBP repeat-containing protein, partial [Chloroflexi bacterium]|nr:SBBP repeat-containing protein [Chloroflexota bacterium]
DYGYGIAVDSSGAVYVTGRTQSANFPLSNAYQPASGGNLDAFISKLSADGQTLLYSSYLGGSGTDVGWGIAADDNGNAYISGSSNSTNFPLRNAFQGTFGGGANDAFITRINTTATGNASLIYSTYLGGSQSDYSGGSGVSALGHGIAADNSGHAYVTGSSNSDNFPILNGFQITRVNDFDVFAAKVDTNASGATSLMYSTYLGGNNGDFGRDIAIDGAGNAYVAGDAAFSNFPTRSAYGPCGSGPFVAKFNMALAGDASLIYSTCFGTLAHGSAVAVAVDGNGNAVMAGFSSSNTWPLVNQLMGYSGAVDVIVTKLNQTGNNLVYSTYLGGAANDSAYGVAVASTAGASHTYVAGSTTSTNYPTVNAFQGANAGAADGFVSDINEPAIPPSPTPSATLPPTSTPTRTPSPIPTATRPPTSTPTRTPSPTSTPVVCRPSFSDVQQSDYFYQAVQYLYCHNVISGYADGTFRPYNNTTRGQMTKIVVLGFNLPIYTPSSPTFTDVPLGSTFYNYVETAVQDGIVAGYACGGPSEPCPGQYFRPGANVTRGQLSKIVVIAASQVRGWEIISPPQASFTDVPLGSTFYNYVETAVRHGLISGYPCGGPGEPCPGQYFRPGNSATRGQISKIVYLAITGQRVNRQANK